MADLTLQNVAYQDTATVRQTARDLYEGADVVKASAGTYLYQETNETDAQFTLRTKRAAYENLPRKIIDWRQGVMFRKEHKREVNGQPDTILDNVDNKGTSAATFFADIAREAAVDGVRFVVIDAPTIPDAGYVSKADEERAGYRPFFESVPANSVLDWAFDVDGSLLWVVIAQTAPDRREHFGEEYTAKTQYKVWTKNDWTLYSDGADEIEKGANNTGVVPVVPFYGVRYTDMAGWPICRPILDHCILLYNKLSDLDWFERLASHPFPVIKSPKKPDKLDTGQGLWIETSPNSGEVDAKYLEISGAGFDSLRQSISDIRVQIVSTMLGQNRKETAQVESVDSQREYKKVLAACLSVDAAGYETSEQICWDIYGKWVGADSPVTVVYNRDYDDTLIDSAMIALLNTLADSSRITTRTLLQTMKEGELLPSEFDVDAELKILESEETKRAASVLASLKEQGEHGDPDALDAGGIDATPL
jgi:hypothetical protein